MTGNFCFIGKKVKVLGAAIGLGICSLMQFNAVALDCPNAARSDKFVLQGKPLMCLNAGETKYFDGYYTTSGYFSYYVKDPTSIDEITNGYLAYAANSANGQTSFVIYCQSDHFPTVTMLKKPNPDDSSQSQIGFQCN